MNTSKYCSTHVLTFSDALRCLLADLLLRLPLVEITMTEIASASEDKGKGKDVAAVGNSLEQPW